MEEPDLPRRAAGHGADAANMLASEDLAPYSRAELDERIGLLETELARIALHRDKAAAHRSAADALFGRKP